MSRQKTRRGRLAVLDRVILDQERPILEGAPGRPAMVADVGLGALPWTTLELVDLLRRHVKPAPAVVGIDVDPHAVRRARGFGRPGLRFLIGDLRVNGLHAHLLRVMNVLRDYRPADVPQAHARLGSTLIDGGLALEGSCGAHGEVGTVLRLRKRGAELHREGLWFWTDGSRGSAPILFRDRLPRDLRRAVRPDHALGRLMARWMEAHAAVRDAAPGLPRLEASVRALEDPALTTIGDGVVAWTPPGGVPPG